jgi:hypothetical protein
MGKESQEDMQLSLQSCLTEVEEVGNEASSIRSGDDSLS